MLAPEEPLLWRAPTACCSSSTGRSSRTTTPRSPSFDESEVVTGTVVRIDKDEVLLDIGWKSEGIILFLKLSIRRSVDPADEVALGEHVDALVLTKEDSRVA